MFAGVATPGSVLADPYASSRIARIVKEKRFLGIYDMDGTYAAGSMEARRKVKEWTQNRGGLVFSTARTPELVLSRGSYQMSRTLAGFARGEPREFVTNGVRHESPLDTLDSTERDPDAILAFGQGVYLAGYGCELKGYAPYFLDRNYQDRYLDPRAQDGVLLGGMPWRAHCLKLVEELGYTKNLSTIDRAGAYGSGEANVEPLEFRIQLEFRGADAIEQKYRALERIQTHLKDSPLQTRVEGVDESKPSDDVAVNRGTLYLMPPEARKEDMVNHLLVQNCRQARLQTSQIKGLMAGDMLTDLFALCEGGLDADIPGILVGGSPLNKCIEEKANFAGVDLRHLHSSLIPSGRDGFYYYDNPLTRGGIKAPPRRRTIVIGDQAYRGTVGVETIWAYIDEHKDALA